VVKHAHASRAQITVEQRNGSVIVEVADDGIGGASAATGTGLAGLIDRVAALNGRLTVSSTRSVGTRLSAEIPLP
jgi:signal transduction histidine kinase